MADALVAEGDGWSLRWLDHPGRRGLLCLAHHDHGQLTIDEPLPAFAVTGRLAWGFVADDAIAVRVVGEQRAVVAAVEGPTLDGLGAWFVPIDDRRDPVRVEVLDRDGSVVATRVLVPPRAAGPALDVRAAHRTAPAEQGIVIGEGTVGDATWDFAVATLGDELHTAWSLRSPGGGGGGSGMGPVPEPTGGRLLGVKGSGTSAGCWHLEAWTGPTIARAELCLDDGGRVDLPVLGRELGLRIAFLAVALPLPTGALFIDGFDAGGAHVDRLWLTGHVSYIRASVREELAWRAAAVEPVPAPIASLWRRVFPGTEPSPSIEVEVAIDELEARWPLRPLLLPATGSAVIGGGHRRWAINQVVHLDVRVDLDDGITVRQGVSWSSVPGARDPSNARVRGRDARLDVMTEAVNGIDEIALSWREPGPADVWVSVVGRPPATVDDVLAVAESLVRVD